MSIMPIVTARIGRRSDILYIGVHFMAISNGGYYIYAAKLS